MEFAHLLGASGKNQLPNCKNVLLSALFSDLIYCVIVNSIAQRLKRVETINIVYQQKQHLDPKISSDAILPVTVYFYDKEIGPVQV